MVITNLYQDLFVYIVYLILSLLLNLAGKHFVFDAEFDENLHMLRMEELLEGLVVFRP